MTWDIKELNDDDKWFLKVTSVPKPEEPKDKPVQVYECYICETWHIEQAYLTHMKKHELEGELNPSLSVPQNLTKNVVDSWCQIGILKTRTATPEDTRNSLSVDNPVPLKGSHW